MTGIIRTTQRPGMRTYIDIDDALLHRASKLTGLKTKRDIVHAALETLVRLKEQERIRRYRGKLRRQTVQAEEARARAERLIKSNKRLFRRLT